MKKSLSILIITVLILMLLLPTVVHAYSFTLEATLADRELSEGENVEIPLTLKNINMGDGMVTVEGWLSFDTDVFPNIENASTGATLINPTVVGMNNWSITLNREVGNERCGFFLGTIMPSPGESPITEDTQIGVLRFKVNSNLTDSIKANAKPIRIYNIKGSVDTLISAPEQTINYTFSSGSNPTPGNETITGLVSTASVKVGNTIQLSATSSKGANITWTSSSPSVATVNSNGVVTGVSSGTTTITARGESATATCIVTVYPKSNSGDDNPTDPTDPNDPTNPTDPDDGNFTNISNMKFSVEQPTAFNYVNIKLKDFKPKDGHLYYAYITQNGSYTFGGTYEDLPKGRRNIVYSKDKNEYYIAFSETDGARLITEETKDAYLVIIEQNSNNYKMILNPTKIEKTTVNANLGGGYIESFHYVKTQSTFNNSVHFTGSRKVTYKIGEVKDNSILASIAKKESGAFSKLLTYAKADTSALGTGSFSFDNETTYTTENVAVKTGKISSGKYYYVYAVADTESDKYVPVEDVVVFNGYDDGTFTHFAFAGSATDEEKNQGTSGTKDNTTAGKEIPQTGTNEIIAIVVVTVLTISGTVAFIGYRKNRI